jgi:hypothetical protein
MPSFVKYPIVSNGLDSSTSSTVFCVSRMKAANPDSFVSTVVDEGLEVLFKRASFQPKDSSLSQETYSLYFVTPITKKPFP